MLHKNCRNYKFFTVARFGTNWYFVKQFPISKYFTLRYRSSVDSWRYNSGRLTNVSSSTFIRYLGVVEIKISERKNYVIYTCYIKICKQYSDDI